MNTTCGCCTGIGDDSNATLWNRPGLNALAYRIGTHAQFLATLKAQLSSHRLAIPLHSSTGLADQLASIRPLQQLTTRSADDPAIALLDAWAVIADVLTFYQERIANEGYLRTATERRSVLELARLIGYALRPGVASSVHLAYEIEQGQIAQIPAGSRAQSVPGPGELPQSFETSDPIEARTEWSALKPRLTRPQQLTPARFARGGKLYLKGIANNLKANDPLLLNFGQNQQLYRVIAATPAPLYDRTELVLEPWLGPELRDADDDADGDDPTQISGLGALIRRLEKPASIPPANKLGFNRTLKETFATGSDAAARLVVGLRPEIRQTLYAGWRSLPVTSSVIVEPHALRARATLFGSSAPKKVIIPQVGKPIDHKEWDLKSSNVPPPEEVQVDIGIIARAGSDGSSSDSDNGEDSQPVESAAIALAVQIAGVTALSAVPVLLPEPGERQTGELMVGTTLVSFELVRALQSPTYQLSLSFATFETSYNIEISIEGGDFAVSNTSSNLSSVEIIGNLGSVIGLSATLPPPLLIIRARGLLAHAAQPSEDRDAIWLDAAYPQIAPRSWVALEVPSTNGSRLILAQVEQASERARADYGISAKSTYLKLNQKNGARWLQDKDTFSTVRGAAVYGQSEQLVLAEEPISEPVAGNQITLGLLLDGLDAGRWLIVAGERADIPGVAGVRTAELVMLAGVRQGFDPAYDGDRSLSTLLLVNPLAYTYKRDSTTIYANVVHATHGETRAEVLGGGDGGKALQSFTLKQSPLTYVSAITPAGLESTLELRINDVRWHEVAQLSGSQPTDHHYVTKTGDDGKISVLFGDGMQGARLPTGSENVRASYRVGIGKAGNVEAEKITLLASRPLGVKGVNNPLPAAGGANAESRDHARENAPLAVSALDRLVSVQDYEDFARTFAGIGKSSSTRLSDGRREVVHVTIAGADDIAITPTTDLYRNLRAALHDFGESSLPVALAVRELFILIIDAGIKLHPDYLWEAVEPKIRQALHDTFSFARRRLGQDALLTEAIAAIQALPGVVYVDVDSFGAVAEKTASSALGTPRTQSPEEIGVHIRKIAAAPPQVRVRASLARRDGARIRPAQLALLLPEVEATLVLRRLPA